MLLVTLLLAARSARPVDDSSLAHISNLIVRREYRGGGLASALHRTAVEVAGRAASRSYGCSWRRTGTGLVGATPRQVRSMARWEAALIIAIGLGLGLAIAAIAQLPLSHALGSGLPYVPARAFAAIIAGTALLALLALALPTRHALHIRPIEAIGVRE